VAPQNQIKLPLNVFQQYFKMVLIYVSPLYLAVIDRVVYKPYASPPLFLHIDGFSPNRMDTCLLSDFMSKFLIPVCRHLQTIIDAEYAVPVEFRMGLVAAQFKQLCDV